MLFLVLTARGAVKFVIHTFFGIVLCSGADDLNYFVITEPQRLLVVEHIQYGW